MRFTEHMQELIRRRQEGEAREIMRFTGKLGGRRLATELDVEVPQLWKVFGPAWCQEPPWRACVIKPTSGSNSRGVLPLERADGLRSEWRSLLGDGRGTWPSWQLWSLQEQERHQSEGVDPYRKEWLVEELVVREDPNGALLLPYDWKCYCLGGRCAWINQVDKTSSRRASRYRTRHWWRTPFCGLEPARRPIIVQERQAGHLPRPRWPGQLLEVADRIARRLYEEEGSPFVRVDLYEHDHHAIVFGEITPHPSGGREVYTEEADVLLGRLWSELGGSP